MNEELFKNLGKTDEKPAEETKQEAPKQVASTSGSNDDGDNASENQAPKLSELDMLKQRAKLMGITFSNNIGVEALKAKIEEHKAAATAKTQETTLASTEITSQNGQGNIEAKQTQGPKAKKISLRAHLQNEKMKLIRLRITNLDPKKKDLPGEILTVANEYLGTVRKFIPFGEQTDNGYHVPYCLYEMMKNRKFLSIKTRKGPKGQTIVEQQWAREFALEVLPPLTEAELARLSTAQQAAGGIE